MSDEFTEEDKDNLKRLYDRAFKPSTGAGIWNAGSGGFKRPKQEFGSSPAAWSSSSEASNDYRAMREREKNFVPNADETVTLAYSSIAPFYVVLFGGSTGVFMNYSAADRAMKQGSAGGMTKLIRADMGVQAQDQISRQFGDRNTDTFKAFGQPLMEQLNNISNEYKRYGVHVYLPLASGCNPHAPIHEQTFIMTFEDGKMFAIKFARKPDYQGASRFQSASAPRAHDNSHTTFVTSSASHQYDESVHSSVEEEPTYTLAQVKAMMQESSEATERRLKKMEADNESLRRQYAMQAAAAAFDKAEETSASVLHRESASEAKIPKLVGDSSGRITSGETKTITQNTKDARVPKAKAPGKDAGAGSMRTRSSTKKAGSAEADNESG